MLKSQSMFAHFTVLMEGGFEDLPPCKEDERV